MLPSLRLLPLLLAPLLHSSEALHSPWLWLDHSLGAQRYPNGDNDGAKTPLQAALPFSQSARSIRKMSLDEGEMFFPHYWTFDGPQHPLSANTSNAEEDEPIAEGNDVKAPDWKKNYTDVVQPLLHPAFALHQAHAQSIHDPLLGFLRHPRALAALAKRDLSCPSDTTACKGIGRPNSCCPQGLTCQSITDSGAGDVGCCADGDSCGEDVGKCAEDQQSCPGKQGGGCCIAGYSCADVGCVAASTFTVTVNPTVTLSPSSTSSSSPPPSSNTTKSAVVSTSLTTSIETGPSSTITSATTEIAPPVLPVRPTSGSPSVTETTTGPTTTFTPSSCPTGFYACNAHYLGGCCRVGRDCSSTSCPAPSSSLALNSNGVTIGVAPPVTSRLGEDGCALGWFRCDNAGGGGCCPSGYGCGQSCTATGVDIGGGVTGTATVAKDNGAGSDKEISGRARIVVVASVTAIIIVKLI